MKKSNRIKEHEVRAVNWEKIAKSVHLDSCHLWRGGWSFPPSIGRGRLTSVSAYCYNLLQVRRGECVREPFLYLFFLKFFSLKYSIFWSMF